MCGSFGQKKLPLKKVTLEVLPEVEIPETPQRQLSLNNWAGNYAVILQSGEATTYQWGMFGFTPSWSQKLNYWINARVEGDFNEDNNPEYNGELGIFKKPAYRSAIKERRCIIPMDFFVEGPEKLAYKKPYLVRLKNQETIFCAGIYEDWTSKTTGEIIRTFAILTTAAAPLLKEEVGHHRSPLILNANNVSTWINPESQIDDVKHLMKVFNSSNFEAYQIDPAVVKSRQNNPAIEQPFSSTLF